MPLSEFLKKASGTLGSDQQKMASTNDLSSLHENELVELVWENGQIMMQGQSSRAKKIPSFNNSSLSAPKYTGHPSTLKIAKFGVMNSMLNDMPLPVPTGEMDLSQEDYVVPWLSYSADDSLQQDDCSQILPDISGVPANEPSRQMIGGSHNVPINNVENLEQRSASKVSHNSRFSLLRSWSSQKSHASAPSLGSGVSNVGSGNTIKNPVSVLGNSNQSQASAGGMKSMTFQDQNMTSSHSRLFNFAHFSRPATFLKGNLNGETAVSGSSTIEVKGNKERGNVASSRNPVSAVPAKPRCSSEKEKDRHLEPNLVSSKVDSRTSLPCHLDRPCPVQQSDNLCRDNASNNDKSPGQFTGENTIKEHVDGERNVEPAVACSSVCSASGAERASSDHPHNLKRKSYESGCRSEEVEEESFGVKRAYPVDRTVGSKRGRAAEVHNLSERRRRDKINEKMRALQELIPNCNKADKASMLDEAIEYLKSLQLQIQIMSLGAGLCVPPVMFPMGMQHMLQFPPMGLRMGMGFGMGMLENGGSPGFPTFPVPTMQRAHFPSPPISGSALFPGIAGYNLHAFGHPGQGLSVSAAQSPSVPLVGQPSASSAVGLNVARPVIHVDIPSQVQETNAI